MKHFHVDHYLSHWILEAQHYNISSYLFDLFKESALCDIRMGWFSIGCCLNVSGYCHNSRGIPGDITKGSFKALHISTYKGWIFFPFIYLILLINGFFF